ncbi:uncharacterized protein PG986_005206 [Apiospora aurea]|uniref:Uncharacterized protein n=1 Tax=Apiospora aurea TaxID=335848 RepID=A0ABR1QGW5_9PEZI
MLEATPFLYSQNHFELRNIERFGDDRHHWCESIVVIFARTIGRDNASLVRHVTIQFPYLPPDGGYTVHPSWLDECSSIVSWLVSEAPTWTTPRRWVNFFSLPGELRNQIYAHLLVHPGLSIPIHKHYPGLPRNNRPVSSTRSWTPTSTTTTTPTGQPPLGLEPAILRASKQTHAEARSVLYAQNRFDLCAEFNRLAPNEYRHYYLTMNSRLVPQGRTLAAFARAVEAHNAGLVRRISILFPYLTPYASLPPGDTATPKEKGSQILDLIGAEFPNLRAVDIFLCQDLRRRHAPKADLALIDAKRRAMPLLNDIAVYTTFCTRRYAQDFSIRPSLREKIVRQGWTVSPFYAPMHGDKDVAINDDTWSRQLWLSLPS